MGGGSQRLSIRVESRLPCPLGPESHRQCKKVVGHWPGSDHDCAFRWTGFSLWKAVSHPSPPHRSRHVSSQFSNIHAAETPFWLSSLGGWEGGIEVLDGDINGTGVWAGHSALFLLSLQPESWSGSYI